MKNLRAAFRFALFVTATLGIYSIWFIGDFFVSNKIKWRQTIFETWAKSFVKISKMRVEINGKPPAPPFFLVCNHLGYTDIPALRVAAKGIFVAKSEVNGWFLAGKIVRDMGTIFINRAKRRDIPRAGNEIVKRLDAGEGVIVFPEGTSTKGETILPFNSSFLEFAAARDLPVSFAAISYLTNENEPTASASVCWWDDKSFVEHLWHLFRLKEFKAIINFGDAPVHSLNRKELAALLREKVSAKFIPVN